MTILGTFYKDLSTAQKNCKKGFVVVCSNEGCIVVSMKQLNPGGNLARIKWGRKTKAERVAHAKMMSEAAQRARKAVK